MELKACRLTLSLLEVRVHVESACQLLIFLDDDSGVRETNMGASVPTEDLITFGVLNADGTPKDPKTFKTIEVGTAT